MTEKRTGWYRKERFKRGKSRKNFPVFFEPVANHDVSSILDKISLKDHEINEEEFRLGRNKI
jgi:hypothetical protein